MSDLLGGSYSISLIEELLPDGSSAWTAVHDTLTGCHGTGRSEDEALFNLSVSREAWLAWANKHRVQVPAPSDFPTRSTEYALRPGVLRTRTAFAETAAMTIEVAA